MYGGRLPVAIVMACLMAFAGLARAEKEVVAPDHVPGTTKVDAEGEVIAVDAMKTNTGSAAFVVNAGVLATKASQLTVGAA